MSQVSMCIFCYCHHRCSFLNNLDTCIEAKFTLFLEKLESLILLNTGCISLHVTKLFSSYGFVIMHTICKNARCCSVNVDICILCNQRKC